jgi:hypothetical protein
MSRRALWIFAAVVAVMPAAYSSAQTTALPAGLTVIEGREPDSGSAYTRLTLSAEGAQAAPAESPALTIECFEVKAKRKVGIYVDFGGVDRTFHAPAKPDPITHFPPSNPSVRLKLTFEGYKPFKDSWEMMPSGEYRYRSPGLESPNLDQPSLFLWYMYAVPVVHVSFADGKESGKTAEFHTSGLIAEMRKRSLCNP